MRPPGSFVELERRRRLAVKRVLDGLRPSEVAQFLGVDESSIRRWMQAYRKSGKKGLRAQTPSGRPRKLTKTQEKIVLRWLDDNPMEHGFPNELWTSVRLNHLIHKEFGVRFNPDYLTTWLRARGCTPQKPERVPRQRDMKVIGHWVDHDWPRIKKKRKGVVGT